MRHSARISSILLLFLAFAGPLALPGAVQAAEAVVPQETAYEALYSAIIASSDQEAVIDNQIETIKQTMLQDPNISTLESIHPGLLVRFGDTMRPWLIKHSDRLTTDFKPRFIAMFQEELTAKDARRMADFYASPTGIKLVHNVSRAYTGANTLSDIDDFDKPIDQADLARDMHSAELKGASALTAADMASPEAAIFKDAALIAKMSKVGERVVALRAEMENVQPTPEISAGIETSLDKMLKEYQAELEGDVGK